ncbi:hypothetical protein [Beijerinckia sp. L45]|uniref:hypothetical protein n=1 Tax=Beijerinckia sp. L45 TaxID=1641855 RepID=UPI00131C8BB0|nr:hypothetical protein [Beijerinckia sp. L45]
MQIVDVEFRVRSLAGFVGTTVREAPLASLLDDAMAVRFHRWHGRSGQRYTATVYSIDHDDPASGLPDLGPAVLIAVARHGARRAMVGLVTIERDSDWAHAVARLHPGADEWHVHLLAPDRAARAAVLADLGTSQRVASVA